LITAAVNTLAYAVIYQGAENKQQKIKATGFIVKKQAEQCEKYNL
jgi:hypothetical protein